MTAVLRRGQTALVTGASSGIGREFAERLAGRGLDLIVVARREERLIDLRDRLQGEYGVEVTTVRADLAMPDFLAQVEAGVATRHVDVLVNAAGSGVYGSSATSQGLDVTRERDMVAVNVDAVVVLTSRYLPGMVARGSGALVNIASTAAFQPVPFMAAYGATKSFVLNYTEALWTEARGSGVRVMAVCPGTTQSEFNDVVGAAEVHVGHESSTEQVVLHALKALEGRKPATVVGLGNIIQSRLPYRFLPRSVHALVTGGPWPPSRTSSRGGGRGLTWPRAPPRPATIHAVHVANKLSRSLDTFV